MAHFLFSANYTQVGIQGLLKEGAASRAEVVAGLATDLGGHLEAAYWAFGSDDFVAIAELPDNAAAAALATTVSASGAVQVRTTVLLSATEVDDARGRRVAYRAPGA